MLNEPLLQGSFSGAVVFSQLIRDALACAAREGWPQMIWSDANFEDWPLREKAVIDSLYVWAKKGRQLTLLAHSYESVLRYQPRMVTWRKTWGHIVECRVCKQVEVEKFPSALWSPLWVMERRDLSTCKGMAGFEAQRRVQLKEVLTECQRHSAPGFPSSVLGL